MTTSTANDYDTLKAKHDALEAAYVKLLANYVNLQRQVVARDRTPSTIGLQNERSA